MSVFDFLLDRKKEPEEVPVFGQKKIPKPKDYGKTRTYDYSTETGRVLTAEWLFDQARIERTVKEDEWRRFNNYYNFAHDSAKEIAKTLEEMDYMFKPAMVPDPFIMVESQITPDVPMPEFHGRDSRGDDMKAERRQKAVQFVIDNNRLSDMNPANERRLKKYGDAFWKVYWDDGMLSGEKRGDIRVTDIPVENIYPDPTAKRLEDCEYIDHVYTIHKNRFYREYCGDLKKKNIALDDIISQEYRAEDDFLSPTTQATNFKDDMIQVLEHWFKQPFDDPHGKFSAGDIACTIQAAGKEIRYIPKYWERTGGQNKTYPFIHYWCIQDETSFWNKSELDPILDLVDTADRELANGILNDAMMANDVIVTEEGALADGEEFTNIPGAVIKVRQGKMNSVARLGGLQSSLKSIETINWLLGQIQRTNRNYDTNNGQETSKVTTASGLLQLRSDAQVQNELKKSDRNKGFCRLYELIDWTCLEFYTDDRMLYIGIDDGLSDEEKENAIPTMLYNASDFAVKIEAVRDMETQAIITPEQTYYPRIDVTVTTGEGLAKNPASTVQVLDRLAAVQVTADNYKLLSAELDYLDIPQKQQIEEAWEKKFTSNIPEEVITALENSPELLQSVQELAQSMPQPQAESPQANVGVNDIVTRGELPIS